MNLTKSQKLFDFYAKAVPNSAFSKLKNSSDLFETHTADVGGLLGRPCTVAYPMLTIQLVTSVKT